LAPGSGSGPADAAIVGRVDDTAHLCLGGLMTRILLTGFEPFGGQVVNSSAEAVRLVAAAPPPGVTVTTAILPVAFGAAGQALRAALRRYDPDVVIATGQAGGRPDVTVERVAVNLADARIPDNQGSQPIDVPVVPGGPAAYFATLPVKACTAAVEARGIAASVSYTAGTFVCNHTFYTLMHLLAAGRPGTRGGFVHLPSLPQAVGGTGKPSLAADRSAEALRAIAVTTATTGTDLKVSAGTLH
jgi:pyroglutamyl-peptidase